MPDQTILSANSARDWQTTRRSGKLLIGFGAQTYFSGAMADLRLYARALKAEDAMQIHANQTAQRVSRMHTMNEKGVM